MIIKMRKYVRDFQFEKKKKKRKATGMQKDLGVRVVGKAVQSTGFSYNQRKLSHVL